MYTDVINIINMYTNGINTYTGIHTNISNINTNIHIMIDVYINVITIHISETDKSKKKQQVECGRQFWSPLMAR